MECRYFFFQLARKNTKIARKTILEIIILDRKFEKTPTFRNFESGFPNHCFLYFYGYFFASFCYTWKKVIFIDIAAFSIVGISGKYPLFVRVLYEITSAHILSHWDRRKGGSIFDFCLSELSKNEQMFKNLSDFYKGENRLLRQALKNIFPLSPMYYSQDLFTNVQF